MIFSEGQLRYLLDGAGLALGIALMAALLGLVVSFAVSFARMAPWAIVRGISTLYVEAFRGTSVYVQLFVMFYVLPFFGLVLPAIVTGVLALGLNVGAYGAEVVRAAIINIDRGQREAAIALNLTPLQTMQHVILPQAVLAILPPFGNFLISLVLATSLLSLITVNELTFRGGQLIQMRGGTTQTLLVVAVIYFVVCFPLSRLVRRLEAFVSKHEATAA